MRAHHPAVTPRPGWGEDLASARSGSPSALGRLLDDFRPYLLSVAGGALDADLQAKAGASDLVQESLLEAQRDFGGFAGRQPEQFQFWLLQILLHNAQNLRRHYRETAKRDVSREVPLPAHDPGAIHGGCVAAKDPSPSSHAVGDEKAARLRRALARLPEHYRNVLSWRHRDGCTFAVIGTRLGRTADAARVIWGRALRKLKAELGGES